jgi:hypothetical protein
MHQNGFNAPIGVEFVNNNVDIWIEVSKRRLIALCDAKRRVVRSNWQRDDLRACRS